MANSLETRITSNNTKFFTLIIIGMAIFLNQSNIMFGLNISFSDFFCGIALAILVFRKRLQLPVAPVIFFLLLSAFLLFTSVFYVPYRFDYLTESQNIIVNYIKLVIIFLYFVIGYNLIYQDLIKRVLKWYSIFALLIGVLGIIFIILNIKPFEFMFLSYRFKGLMNDPNYFAIIQVSALVYFSRASNIGRLTRRLALLLVIVSIIASGSKTGIITLLCYVTFRLIESLFKLNRNAMLLTMRSLTIIVIVLLAINLSSLITETVRLVSLTLPSFSRIQVLFVDFGAAISGSGSGRDSTWGNALEIIKLSPLLGVGVGTYSGISLKLFGTGLIAHNTYLQLFSEWGLLLASILFIYIIYIICKVTFNKELNTELNCILRDILIIFLLGSFAVSLNNARMIWFFLGIIVFNIVRQRGKSNDKSLQ